MRSLVISFIKDVSPRLFESDRLAMYKIRILFGLVFFAIEFKSGPAEVTIAVVPCSAFGEVKLSRQVF